MRASDLAAVVPAGVMFCNLFLLWPALAADLDPIPSDASLPSFEPKTPYHELRAGVLSHDALGKEFGFDLNAEYLSAWLALGFKVPLVGADAMLRPHLGADLNLSGDTSSLYAGYTLTIDLTDRIFAEGSFGAMVHNGKHDSSSSHHLALGCNLLFRESASLGWHITEHWNVLGTVSHASNGGGCEPNNGLTNMGIRVGYAF